MESGVLTFLEVQTEHIRTLALGRLCWLQLVSNLQLGTMDCNLLNLTGDLQDT